jgi:hypothetical protein
MKKPIRTINPSGCWPRFSLLLFDFAIIGLVYYVTSANKPMAGADDGDAIAEHIRKSAWLRIRDANPSPSARAVYKAQCVACRAA